MTRNPKGVLGQIEGLKESFEAVLRKRTQYRQQINQLTACLRERNREIKDLVRRVNELQERDANAELIIQELQERVTARGDLIANQEVEINDLYCSVNEWREKARALAAELSGFVGPPAVEFRPSRSVVAVVQPLGGPERYCLPVGFWITRDRGGGCAVWDKESFEVAHDPAP